MKRTFLCAVFLLMTMLLSASIASAGAILEGILKKGELVVGISGDQPPLNAVTKEGTIIGFDADLAKQIATKMNLKIRFARMPFTELIDAVQSGKVDIVISGMTITPERKLKVAFAGPYYISGKGMLVKRSNLETLKKETLNSEKIKVSTLEGSTSHEIVEKVAPKAKLLAAGSYSEALEMLYQDKVDAIVADYPYCAYIANRYPGKKLALWDTKLSVEPLGIAVQEDPQLINILNDLIKAISETGEIMDIEDRWFLERDWIDQLP